MQIERIYYPVKSLGYGERVGIWTVGCPRSCPKCSNPELQQPNPCKDIELEKLFSMLNVFKGRVDGVTISGGEPFLQAEELSRLVWFIKENISEDILLYTGYTLHELRAKKSANIDNILGNIAVLIDGEYIDELNDNLPLRGSSNQVVHYLKKQFKETYEALLSDKRTVQNVFCGDGLVSIGIPVSNFRQTLEECLKQSGIRVDA